MVSFEEFCGGPLWNETQFLSASWPEFTPCMVSILPTWPPAALLVLFGPCYARVLYRKDHGRPFPLGSLYVGRMFCLTTMAILSSVQLLQDFTQVIHGMHVTPVSFVSDGLRIGAIIVIACVGHYEGRKGETSILSLTFWFIYLLGHAIPAYTWTIFKTYKDDPLTYILFFINYFLAFVCLMLNCFSEHPNIRPSKKGYQPLEKPSCPEVTASPASILTFSWMFGLVKTGYKRDLQEKDVWSLPPYMTCELHGSRYDAIRADEKRKCANVASQNMKNQEVRYMKGNYVKSRKKSILDDTVDFYGTQPDSRPNNDWNSGRQPSLFRVLFRQYWDRFALFTAYCLAREVFVVCGPMILHLMLANMNSEPAAPKWQGYGLCVLLLLSGQMGVFCYNQAKVHCTTVAITIRSVLMSALFKKALVLDSKTRSATSIGDMVNQMAVDSHRILEFIIRITTNHTAPLQIALAVTLIYLEIGASVFVGLLFLLLLVPLNLCIASKLKDLMRENLNHKDERVQALNEIFNGIKILKLYAWEPSFNERIEALRASEIGTLYRIGLLYAVFGVVWQFSGFLVTFVTFVTYTLSSPDNRLEPGSAFMTLALFNILKVPLDLLATNIPLAAQCYISYKRINAFLQSGELKTDNVLHSSTSDDVVSFEDTEMSWNLNRPSTLKSINLTMSQGKLVAVVGPVGSGKSSLIHAILGDMEKVKGTVTQKGTIAYVAQQAWIQNATVRNNVLFGKMYRERKYKAVLSACELERDLAILSAGDQTEIGEKGINLSGGQKQRVAVARAVYHDCDLYLLDDPLSAVDSHVGKAMFDHVIGPKGLLKNKTRLFITHGIHFLPQVDLIIVMDNGQVSEVGTYEQLLDHEGPFAQFLQTHLTKEQLDGNGEEDPEVASIKDNMWERIEMLTSDASADENQLLVRTRRRQDSGKSMSHSNQHENPSHHATVPKQGQLVIDETLERGRVSPQIYMSYFKAGGIISLGIAFLNFWVFQAVNVATSYWLSVWSEDNILSNLSCSEITSETNYYLGIYGIFGVAQLVILCLYHYLYWTCMVMTGKNLHAKMISNLLRAPMSFYDTTPIGRIINRCSRDVEIVDNFLPLILKDTMNTLGINAIAIVVIFIQTPLLGLALIPVIILFVLVMMFYIPTSRQLKRIENVTRSQILSHFSESVTGASTIRAFQHSGRFIKENIAHIDNNTSYFYAFNMALRWVNMNLDSLSNFIIFASALFQFLQPDPDPGMAGVTISFTLQISGSMPWMVGQIADFETNLVSVERIQEYSKITPEADWAICGKKPLPSWPEKGEIEFKDYSVRYREGLELVIKDLKIKFESGQKIGVVGRTGAGKSSLSLSLFRLMEAAGGAIFIDGVNIADIGLHDLRSRLTILPQDPVIFSGSIRFNLDPFNEFTDDEIWAALEHAHLKPFVSVRMEKLSYDCGEEGSNLSVGLRQLVCLARSLLHKTKVLILDEATAAVDIQTDTLIQKTICSAFKDCTVIAIAHRLNTILDYDKILILDKGEMKEFDTPENLLNDPNSTFLSMAQDAKLV